MAKADETLQNAIVMKKNIKSSPKYKNIVMITIDINYPQVIVRNKLKISADISRFYSHIAENFYQYASKNLYNMARREYHDSIENNFPFRPFDAVMNFETALNNGIFLSIFYDKYEYTGGAHGMTVRNADTWYIKTGKHMRLKDFFCSPEYKTIFINEIIREIENQIKTGQSFFEDYKNNAANYFNENNYYLSKDGFVIFYPLYSIAPYSSGIVEFTIPFSSFEGFLKKSPVSD